MNSKTDDAPAKGSGRPSKEKGYFSSLYYFFNSIKLTVFLFIILGLVSVAGTIIEQGADPAKYAQAYSETTIRIFRALGLFDMYHTPWFLTVLLLLVLNLIVCTIERLPRVFRFARGIKPVLDEGDEKKYAFMEKLNAQEDALSNVERVFKQHARIPWWVFLIDIASVLFAIFIIRKYPLNILEFVSFIVVPFIYVVFLNFRGALVKTEKDGAVHFFLNQWLISRFGVYITHVSVLIIFIGAIAGSLFGFKGYMGVGEGETLNQMYVRQDKLVETVSASLSSLFSKDTANNPQANRQYKTLPFSIRCDDFSISYYENTGRPKDYNSDLVVLRNGQEETRKTIEVNDPLIVDKIYFYQSSYGPTKRPGQVVLNVAPPGGTLQEYRTPVNGSFRIQGTNSNLQVQSFIPDFTIVEGHVRQRSADMINPAVYISIKEGAKSLLSGWIFPKYPDYSLNTGPYQIEFKDYWGWQYTGLQVAYDPGVEIVWIGCMLMVVGLMISFFHSHQRIWARVRGSEIVLAGSTHKNRMAFENKFNELRDQVKG